MDVLNAGMRMSDPIPTFTHLLTSLSTGLPNLAYISLTEPLMIGDKDIPDVTLSDSNEPFRQIWAPRPVILGGGYSNNVDLAVQLANDKDVLVLFGRAFISNVSPNAC
jgi:NADPH2 dehydrogenase